jgi:hypothetical protein
MIRFIVGRVEFIDARSISPLRLRKVQHDQELDPEESSMIQEKQGNAEADMALFGVQKKLSSILSIECQVQELITKATDPERLSALFHGWQAWL